MEIVIIGNGIAGITAARNIRKMDSDCSITVISGETKFFFSRTALMYVYMGHMKFEHTKPYEDNFWEKNRIDLIQDWVEHVDGQNKKLTLKNGGELSFDKLLIATGSKPNKFGWPGQDLQGVQGLYSYQDLELLEKNTHKAFTPKSKQRVQNAVIVGGGLIGVELAEMLMTRNIKVTFLVREKRFWGNIMPQEEGELIGRHMKDHHVDLRFNTQLAEILPDADGRVRAVKTSEGEEIPCEFVGLTAGVSPNIKFLGNSELSVNRGILVNRKLETNLKDVYAAGDCIEFTEVPPGRKSIEQVWYTGRMMGELAAKNMMGASEAYNPGPWFNSAKFFDIEYQTYGMVGSELLEDEQSFYWENEAGNTCIKIVLNKSDRTLIGVNVFGIRLRHEKMDALLRGNAIADRIIEEWNEIVFDPEFYRSHIYDIAHKYNDQFNLSLKPPKKTWLEKLLA